MRVLLVNPTFGGVSGSGRHVGLLYKTLRDEVDFELWSGKTVGYIDVKMLKTISFYLRCKFKKIPDDIDIIHIHNSKLVGVFKEDKVNVLTIHGSYQEEMLFQYGLLVKPVLWYIERGLKKADVVTCVDPYTAERMGWMWIPNMIDVASIDEIPEADDEPRLLWVGRDDPVKNHELFREIARHAYEKFGVKSLALGIPRGRYRENDWIRYEKVSWSKVISYMKKAYALVITSRVEGFPTIILEAWASRCPVISAPIPSIIKLNEILGQVVEVVDEYDPEEFLLSIKSLLNEDPEKLVARCRSIVEKRFDAKVVSRMYFELYRRLLDQG